MIFTRMAEDESDDYQMIVTIITDDWSDDDQKINHPLKIF
jgi:hypothetical protein